MKENHPMFGHAIQQKAHNAVAAALPFAIDPAKITMEPECLTCWQVSASTTPLNWKASATK
jgi:hypothetical protein